MSDGPPAPEDGSYPAPPDASYPAPPDASYPAPDDGSYPAPDDGGAGVPVRPPPPPPPSPRPPRQSGRARAVTGAVGVGVVLVLGAVGVTAARNATSGSSAGSTYQVPSGPAGRIDVTLSGGINDHFVGSPVGACGTIGMGTSGAQLLQVDTTNSSRTIQFTIQVIPYRQPGTFVIGRTRINGQVFYRPNSTAGYLLSARSGQVQVSSNGGKLSGRFDLQFVGQAVAGVQATPPTHVTGTFSCG